MFHTAEIVSAVCCGVLRTADIIFAVCCAPWRLCCKTLRLSPRCVAHRKDNLRCMLHTVDIVSPVCCTQRRLSLRCVAHCGDHLHSVLHSAHRGDTFVIECLDALEIEFENILACLSRGPVRFKS